MGDIVDISTGKAIADFDTCVIFGQSPFGCADEYSSDSTNSDSTASFIPITLAGDISFVDAAACPESLKLSETDFDKLFKDKIAVWMYSSSSGSANTAGKYVYFMVIHLLLYILLYIYAI
jgi:hypothetical protein